METQTQEIEDLRTALQWALAYIERARPVAEPWDGEDREDYGGATRLAWPDDPDQWLPEDDEVHNETTSA